MNLLQGNHHRIAPVSQPIAICGQFVLNQPQTLVLKEKVLSIGDSFDVNLDNGWPLLKVRGSLLSISGRKRVEDSQGTHLFDIVKEHLHLHTTYALKDPNQQKICEVKSKTSCKLSLYYYSVRYNPE